MANINRVVLVGNLTKDPELRHTPSGTAVCKLRIAVNTRMKDSSGTWVDKPNYFDITVWGNQGESCSQYLAKGRPIAVDGRLDWREWQAQDGAKRESVEIVAESVQFLGSRGDGDSGGGQPVRARGRRLRDRRRLPGRGRRRHPLLGEQSMAPRERQQQRKRPGGPAGAIKRRNCFFCKDKVAEIDYKNINQLRRYISEKGKIRSRRITGACRRHQVQVATAVKRAREMALLPYVAEGADDRERGGGRGRRDREDR